MCRVFKTKVPISSTPGTSVPRNLLNTQRISLPKLVNQTFLEANWVPFSMAFLNFSCTWVFALANTETTVIPTCLLLKETIELAKYRKPPFSIWQRPSQLVSTCGFSGCHRQQEIYGLQTIIPGSCLSHVGLSMALLDLMSPTMS